jgi:hypothetical protein
MISTLDVGANEMNSKLVDEFLSSWRGVCVND